MSTETLLPVPLPSKAWQVVTRYRAFLVVLPTLENGIPVEVCSTSTLHLFRTSVNIWIFLFDFWRRVLAALIEIPRIQSRNF